MISMSRIIDDEGERRRTKYQTIIRFEEEQRKERRLETRVAGSVDSDPSANEDDNVIYYDLCNKDGEIIKVTRNGWQIIKHGDPSSEEDYTRIIIFKHSSNQLPQQRPSKEYPSDIYGQVSLLTYLDYA